MTSQPTKGNKMKSQFIEQLLENFYAKHLDEANSKSSIGEKIIAVLYRDKGSLALRPNMMLKVLGYVGKYLARDWEDDGISFNKTYGDKVVQEMIEEEIKGFDNIQKGHMSKDIRNKLIRPIISKYVAKGIQNGSIIDKTSTYDDNYSGWSMWLDDKDEWKNIYKSARLDLEKAVTLYVTRIKDMLVKETK
jgi:hypothetical protein